MTEAIKLKKELETRRLVELFEKGIIKIGDKIPYRYQSKVEQNVFDYNRHTRVYNFSYDNTEQWQVTGIDNYRGKKCLKIVLDNPSVDVELRGEEGYLQGGTDLNRIAEMLYTGSESFAVRSISVDDINSLFDISIIHDEEGFNGVIQRYNLEEVILREFQRRRQPGDGYIYRAGGSYHGDIYNTSGGYRKDEIKGKEKEKEIVFINCEYWLNNKMQMPYRTIENKPKPVFDYGDMQTDFFDEQFIERGIVYGIGFVTCDFVNRLKTLLTSKAFYYKNTYGKLFLDRGRIVEGLSGRLSLRPVVYLRPDITFKMLSVK